MTTSKIIVAIVIILAIVAGGYLLFTANNNNINADDNNENTQTENERKMSFADFAKTAQSPYRCTVNQNIDGSKVSGTAYINNGMIRGEYSGTAQGMDIDADVIIRDGFAYTWTSVAPAVGIKVPINTNSQTNSQTQNSGTYDFSGGQVSDYDCQPWTADPSVFTLPSGVNFTEIKQ